jgi:hypothetical protein
MSNDIAIIAPLPLPSPADPLPTLPTWFTHMLGAVQTTWVEHNGGAEKRLTLRNVPTPAQKVDIQKYKARLERLLELTPNGDRGHAKKTYGLVAKLMLAKPSRAAGPETAEARMEAYQMALDDIPSWAVALAIRNWHRGECHKWSEDTPDYRWAPESADLRRFALREMRNVKDRIGSIDKVLSAEQYDEAKDFELQREKERAARAAAETAVS